MSSASASPATPDDVFAATSAEINIAAPGDDSPSVTNNVGTEMFYQSFNPEKDVVSGYGVTTPLPSAPGILGTSSFGSSNLVETVADYCSCGTAIGLLSYKISILRARGTTYEEFAKWALTTGRLKMCCLSKICNPTVINIVSEDIGSRRTFLVEGGKIENTPLPTMDDVRKTRASLPMLIK